MKKLVKILKKIKMGKIRIESITNGSITYTYLLDDKELNIAGGKIHRRTSVGDWQIRGKTLVFTSNRMVTFKNVADIFENMVC